MAKKVKSEAPATASVVPPVIQTTENEHHQPVVKKKKTSKKVASAVEVQSDIQPEAQPEVQPVIQEEHNAIVVEEEVTTAEPTENVLVEKRVQRRRLVTKEKLLGIFEEFETEIVPILETGGHKKLLKLFKILKQDTYKLLKIKTAEKKQKDATNSGFMRPVKPSPALELFLTKIGDKNNEPLTRAYLTTLICKYIKDNDLQNPKDRRIIFPNQELKELFDIKDNNTEPLTYYNIQKKIQPHVSRIEDTENKNDFEVSA
jgi:chromatin remodeling complex protein RSC6